MFALAVPAALLAGGCSDKHPLQPPIDEPEPEECVLATLGTTPTGDPFQPAALHTALSDAATRLAPALGDSEASTRLASGLSDLRQRSAGSDDDALCVAFNETLDAVAGWDSAHAAAHPARPDFDLVYQTVALYEAALREHRPVGADS